MKGSSVPAKKGAWNKFTTGVLVLVILSLFVPLIFSIGGLHNKVGNSGIVRDRNRRSSVAEDIHEEENDTDSISFSQTPNRSSEVLIRSISGPNGTSETQVHPSHSDPVHPSRRDPVRPSHRDEMHPSHNNTSPQIKTEVEKVNSPPATEESDSIDKSCEERFGSYCLWCKEHKEVMQDSVVKKMKDRLFMARSYYPSIAKKNQTYEPLTRELKQNIQEFERILSDATTDADLQGSIHQKIENMEAAIAKAEAEHVGCYNVDKKLAQILDLTKDEALFHRRQSAFLYHLGAQTMPKSHHCLSMRLTVEYFRSHMDHVQQQMDHVEQSSPVDNPDALGVQRYAIFSKNLLASSVVINSTLANAKENARIVFYLLTDMESYFAMKHWFSRNRYKSATILVKNIGDYKLESITTDPSNVLHLSASEEFRISIADGTLAVAAAKRTEYLSMFSQAYFFLPAIFSTLKKMVVLGDDVVVQRDLSPLWDIDMQGKVIGASLSCTVRLGHLKGFVKAERWDDSECLWMSAVSVIDLERWRELNLFHKYQQWLQTQKMDATSFRTGALPANLVTVNGQIYGLDHSWVLSGLGYKYGINDETIKSAAVIHYNGNMKPWLEMGIPQYKRHWKKFLKKDDQYMDDCNVSR